MKSLFLLSCLTIFSITANAACYTDVTVNWVRYPAHYNGDIHEDAIEVSFSGTTTTGNHHASFRHMTETKLNAILSILLTAKASGKKLDVYCVDDAYGYTAHSMLIK